VGKASKKGKPQKKGVYSADLLPQASPVYSRVCPAWAKRSGCALRICALKSKPRRACFDRIRAVAGCPALRSGACAIPRDLRTHTAAIRFVGAVSAHFATAAQNLVVSSSVRHLTKGVRKKRNPLTEQLRESNLMHAELFVASTPAPLPSALAGELVATSKVSADEASPSPPACPLAPASTQSTLPAVLASLNPRRSELGGRIDSARVGDLGAPSGENRPGQPSARCRAGAGCAASSLLRSD
jgi:hypothetical protein